MGYKFWVGVLVVFVVLAILFYLKFVRGNAFVEKLRDGSSAYIASKNGVIVREAVYFVGCKHHDVKYLLTRELKGFPGGIFTFDAAKMGLTPGGTLSFAYKCEDK
jgi:hypothetical protein